MNLNKWAKEITLAEGLKKSINIAQVKEVMKLIFKDMSQMTVSEVYQIIGKYAK